MRNYSRIRLGERPLTMQRPQGMQQQRQQTTYNLGPNPGQPGMLSDAGYQSQRIVTVVAGAVIAPGVLCETYVSAGKVLARPVQDAATGGSFAPTLAGISFLDPIAVEQTYVVYPVPPSNTGLSFAGYPIGFPVPFVRRGRIWAAWDGNTGVALPSNGGLQVWHSSDGSAAQGVFTTIAAQATLHSEIDAAGAYINLFDPNLVSGAYTDSFGNVLDMVNLEINLPGHS